MVEDTTCGTSLKRTAVLNYCTKRVWPFVTILGFLGACVLVQYSPNVTRLAFKIDNIEKNTSEEPASPIQSVIETQNPSNLPICPPSPPALLGELKVEENVTVEEAEERGKRRVKAGGRWWPKECQARWSLAVLVSYRDRKQQLGAFLNHMHPFLQRQQLNYSIFLVEQQGSKKFNRALLLNVGFLESSKEGPWDCYAFHDVDMLPDNDHHLYHCSQQPRHLTVNIYYDDNKNSAKLHYHAYFGGACLMTEEQVRSVNGWSNRFWGWGGEDDDMWRRISLNGMSVWRYPGKVARYKMIKHKPQVKNKERFKLLRHPVGYQKDGLNSCNYTATRSLTPLYTHLLADIGAPH